MSLNIQEQDVWEFLINYFKSAWLSIWAILALNLRSFLDKLKIISLTNSGISLGNSEKLALYIFYNI